MDVILPEASLRDAVDLLVRVVEAAGALIIFLGAAVAFVRFATRGLRAHSEVLNYFLRQEIAEERDELERERRHADADR